MISAPGIVRWAINGAKFERDLPAMVRVISDGWGVPYSHAEAMLKGDVPHTIEGETVIFTVTP